jgi:3-oxoacyl-(acyl-carrier-protein) synthase
LSISALLLTCALLDSNSSFQLSTNSNYPHKTAEKLFSFNSLAGRIAERQGLKGGHLLIPTGCVGGCDSISYGYRLIKAGLADRVVVGAAEAPLTPLVVAAFGRIGATSTRNCAPQQASCPFDQRRDGFVLAEGGAMFLLEADQLASSRRARILAELSGCGSVNNCLHMTDIDPGGEAIAESCRRALEDAKVEVSEIDFVNSHGSSTPQNDVAEVAALKKVFGRKIRDIPITSLKSQIGHALSAANAIEMVSTIQSINHAEIPPTINLETQDPECDVTVVANKKVSHKIRRALKTSSGFSGIHTAVVISQYESGEPNGVRHG